MPEKFLSDEDKALFRKAMQTVTPLKPSKHAQNLIKNHRIDHPPPSPLEEQVKKNDPLSPLGERARVRGTFYPLSNYDPHYQPVQSDTILQFRRPSFDLQRFRTLRQGQIRYDARLDLHGQTADMAQETLCQFIQQQATTATRCVLIIHGKGSAQGEAPILKNHVNHWLPQFPQVLAFHSAQPRDGGTGALYVLLKK